MKANIFTLFVMFFAAILFTACETPETKATEPDTEAVTAASTEGMPEDFIATLDAHGGLDSWKEFRQLGYAMPRGEDQETQLVDLVKRRRVMMSLPCAKEHGW